MNETAARRRLLGIARFTCLQSVPFATVAAVNSWLALSGPVPQLLRQDDWGLIMAAAVPVLTLPAYLAVALPLAGRARTSVRFGLASSVAGWFSVVCGLPIMLAMNASGLWALGVVVLWVYAASATWLSIRFLARPTNGWRGSTESATCAACSYTKGPTPSPTCPECGRPVQTEPPGAQSDTA